ncbi:MAG: hypothetical protein U1E27_10880 [Kiritimatiellia bacterium]|nr:hypothetical protein [Kiritimatiellia bacterium]
MTQNADELKKKRQIGRSGRTRPSPLPVMNTAQQSVDRIRWSRRYRTALRRHLLQAGSAVDVPSAHRLGQQAVTMGMETLDVARIHERTRTGMAGTSDSSQSAQKKNKRAQLFFAEVLVPIEQLHRPALKSDAQANELAQSLRLRTRESSEAVRKLKRSVARRQTAEAAFKRGEKHRAVLLAESHRLQRHLRRLTHEILSVQENERKKSGNRLRDETAQTLLAIHIRLLGLKGATQATTDHLKQEIAETQRMVQQSSLTIHRLARAFKDDHES